MSDPLFDIISGYARKDKAELFRAVVVRPAQKWRLVRKRCQTFALESTGIKTAGTLCAATILLKAVIRSSRLVVSIPSLLQVLNPNIMRIVVDDLGLCCPVNLAKA